MKSTKLLSLLVAVPLIFAAGCGQKDAGNATTPGSTPSTPDKKVVKNGISQIVEHQQLKSTREGLLASLKDGGFVDNDNLQVD